MAAPSAIKVSRSTAGNAILRAARNKRQHLSHVLSRNEMERDYAYNRALFRRAAHGWYQFNPTLEVRVRADSGAELWRSVFAALNLPLIFESSVQYSRAALNEYLASAGLPACPLPIMAEREAAQLAEEARREAEMERAELLARREWEHQRARRAADAASITRPRWDMPEARLEARRELQRRIEKAREQGGTKEECLPRRS